MADRRPIVSPSLAANPRLDSWISVGADGAITVSSGKVELGQGIVTALAQIAADELDAPVEQVWLRPAVTGDSPDEGVTSGSMSVVHSGLAIRQAAAEVRRLFLAEAAWRFGVSPESVSVADGVFRAAGNHAVSYGELAGSVSLGREVEAVAAPKAAAERRVAGRDVQRLDVPGRVYATRGYIHDLAPPGMVHGRVLRPPQPGARLMTVDEARFQASCPEATLVRDGGFLGVISESEHEAGRAIAALARCAVWSSGHVLPDEHDLEGWLTSAPSETSLVASREAPLAASTVATIERTYLKPYLAHGSIGPSCAIAEWRDGELRVRAHTQGVYNLRADLALVFKLPPERIVVEHAEGAGCYGHNGADDVALDAALLARAAPGRAVRVQWSRFDELAASPFGAAMLMRLSAALAPDGKVSHWTHDLWSNGHTARPGRASTPALLAATALADAFPPLASSDPPLASGGGAERNAVPGYDFASIRITKHRVLDAPLRTSSMRSLGAIGNVFAIESFMDELAELAGVEPLAFRLAHLRDARGRAVLERAAAMADRSQAAANGRGRGLAYARYKNTGGYCAIVAEVDVSREPRAVKLWIAADIGEVINPDGARNQIEGGAVQSTSWALKEAVRFSREGLECGSWESYPILRFSEVPEVEVELIGAPDAPPLGAGELAQGPTAAAIANAIHAALGVRVRQMPFTRERILAAMEL
jgi:CO/xanthine dehydrogenase Mo-binding subunit